MIDEIFEFNTKLLGVQTGEVHQLQKSEFDCTMDWSNLYSVKPVFQLPLKSIKKVFVID